MAEVGALICEAALNFEDDQEVTSPKSLRISVGFSEAI